MKNSSKRPSCTFLAGLTDDQRQALDRWPHRRFEPGAAIIEHGQLGAGVYVLLEGSAEVLAPGPAGETRQLAMVGVGDLVGELGLFTGQPASSTVRAVTEVEAIGLDGDEALDAAVEMPWLYPALGSVVAERLVRTQRQLLAVPAGRLTVLDDDGAPPLLPVAVGASLAWHTQNPVLLVLVREERGDLPAPVRDVADADDLAALAGSLESEPACCVARVRPGLDPAALAAGVRRATELVPEVVLCGPASRAVDVAADVEARLTGPGSAPFAGELVTIFGWSRAVRRDAIAVGEPRGRELEALAAGRLDLSGPCGQDAGRAARSLTRQRVGLALGSGSARGFAHIGVLRAFARHGIPVDAIAGTSIGGAIAAMHAGGESPDQIFDTVSRAGRVAVRPLGTGRSLLSIAGLRTLIERAARGARFEELPIPLAIVAADLDTGEEVVFSSGKVAPAALASLAIPGVYPPQHVAGRRLIDGAYVDPVPVAVTAALGVDKVVAVRLAARPPVGRVEAESIQTKAEPLWGPQVILRSIDVMSSAIAGSGATTADVLIEPTFHGLGGSLRDFRRGHEYERIGELAAEAVLPELAETLPWVDA